MVEPQMPIARKRDFSFSGAKKAWIGAGALVVLAETGALLLRYAADVNFFGVVPPGLAFLVVPLVGGIIQYLTIWSAKNKPTR